MNIRLKHIWLSAFLLVGFSAMAQTHVKVEGNVFGGGNKAPVGGKTSVLIDQANDTIGGDVYGGGAFANVGTNPEDSTQVTILQGVVIGNVYGGGLGDSTAASYNGTQNIAALVYGKVFVTIGNNSGGPTLKGSVFGCNNINGTPLDSVFVNIFKTAHTTGEHGEHNNQYPNITTLAGLEATIPANPDDPNYTKQFAIAAVYGGGNKASYKPALNSNGKPKCTTVHVYGCEENTIHTIYGGGNAANVGDTLRNGDDLDTVPANTRLILDGGRYDRVFGGGNGFSAATPPNHDHSDEADYNPGANIFGTAYTNVYGGLYRQVFGGSNQYGDIDTVVLTIDKTCTNLLIHESFGGANEAEIHSDVTTTLLCNDYHIGSFYGGSNLADITGNVTLNVRGGNYSNVFGGSKGYKDPADETNNVSADINGNVTLNLLGGTMENAFGGSDVFGNITGAITVNVWDTVALCSLQVDTVYGGGRDAAYTPNLVAGKKIVSPVVNLWNGLIGHSSTKGCVFGGGKGNDAKVTANPKVMIGDTITEHTTAKTINLNGGSIFGGGNAAPVDGIDSVLMLKDNSVVSNLFGGGNKAGADSTVVMMTVSAEVDTIFGGGNLAGLEGAAMVIVTKGTVRGGIYGGSNKDGLVKGNITVNVTDNTDDTQHHTTIGATGAPANIHGGGYGADTRTKGHVTVNYGEIAYDGSSQEIHSSYPLVYGDIYGGSALGWVNDVSDGVDTTTINILNGEIKQTTVSSVVKGGNIYGGGLGDKTNNIAAKVNGKVYVNIGDTVVSGSSVTYRGKAVIDGSVFGCNNLNGSPQDSVFVNIFQTNHGANPAGNLYPTLTSGTWTPELLATNAETQGYAIQSVFGGGNQASYTPAANKCTRVHVFGCENTIKDVFGGGNAANVGTTGDGAVSANTFIVIDGGRFNRVFGGGNGDPVAANIYGTATTTINAGLIDTIFGGSNKQGSITTTSLNLDRAGDCDDEVFRVIFGGANLAPISGNLSTTINCGVGAIGDIYGGSNKATITGNVELNINGGTINYVYGGSKGDNTNNTNASITGDVQLNLYGGTVRHAFGGSNLLGNITGQITVNVLDTVSTPCNLVLDTVYGGGNLAPYKPTTASSSPVVNIINGTVNKFVYGGGLGADAEVKANPVVKVGYDASMASLLTPSASGSIVATGFSIPDTTATVTGDVYGGGDAAPVDGSTSVTLQKVGSSVIKLFGGGNQAGVTGAATITMNHGNVSNGVYGGCNTSGSVNGNINVYVNGGKVGTDRNNLAYGVFGGGFGNATNTGANVTVTIGNSDSIPVIYGDVYGGSAQGHVNNSTSNLTKVWVKKGTIVGDVYGGGFGDANQNALVKGKVQVVVDGGTVDTVNSAAVGGRVFGCNNLKGTPQGTVEVTVNATNPTVVTNGVKTYALKGVYGGGNLANYVPSDEENGYPKVNISGCNTSIQDVFGGGNAAAVPQTDVTVNGGDIKRVFAGGNGTSGAAHVGYNTNTSSPTNAYGLGTARDTIKGGTITQVFGGSNTSGAIRSSSAVYVNKSTETGACPMKLGEVYGGGNLADGNAGDITIGCTGTWTTGHDSHNSTTNRIGYELEGIGTVYGGANRAGINNNIVLNIKSGIIENVFGGNNTDGNISGTITVNIEKDNSACGWYVGNVYGGGNLASYSYSGSYPQVNIKNGTVSGDVFGGGLGASAKVKSNPVVTVGDPSNNAYEAIVSGNVYGGGSAAMVGDTVSGGTVSSSNSTTVRIQKNNSQVTKVFGGGKEAGVTGTTGVTITDGTINGGVYGGCDSQGNVTGKITVDVKGGTLGSAANLALASPVTVDVYGGGFGASTTTSGDVEVNIGECTSTNEQNDYPKIYGDVYGGSAFGSVNSSNSNTTTVNVLNGTLYTYAEPATTANGQPYSIYHGGNVYGGGLGDRAGSEGHSDILATEYGKIVVNIGASSRANALAPDSNIGQATIGGNVYGCNNTNGSPLDDVTVNIYRTYRTATDEFDYSGTGTATYALNDVFGGGNQADYTPNAAGKKSSVLIHGCYNTVERVFGGSNAAASGIVGKPVEVKTDIAGGRFYEVFGGGNGEVSAANIIGDVNLGIHGGLVDEFYVGSNQQGSITGQSNVVVNQTSGCQEITITEFYCGGKYANFVGDIKAIITCNEGMNVTNLYGGCKEANVVAGNGGSGNVHLVVKGGTYENVYGGSKGYIDPANPSNNVPANIEGNIILDIFGGTVTNAVYGGSNILGNVAGTITVNVYDSIANCALDLNSANIYGGGNQADYTAPTSTPNYPQVNIKKATVKNVFGGGLKAEVKGNPQIKIKEHAKVLENVYGGGNLGKVEGDPKVIVNGKDKELILVPIDENNTKMRRE